MKKPTKCRTGVLSQFGASIFAARPARNSNFALGERKIKKNCPVTTNQHSKKFCALYYIVVVIADGQCVCTKNIYNCRKDDELVRLLCS